MIGDAVAVNIVVGNAVGGHVVVVVPDVVGILGIQRAVGVLLVGVDVLLAGKSAVLELVLEVGDFRVASKPDGMSVVVDHVLDGRFHRIGGGYVAVAPESHYETVKGCSAAVLAVVGVDELVGDEVVVARGAPGVVLLPDTNTHYPVGFVPGLIPVVIPVLCLLESDWSGNEFFHGETLAGPELIAAEVSAACVLVKPAGGNVLAVAGSPDSTLVEVVAAGAARPLH